MSAAIIRQVNAPAVVEQLVRENLRLVTHVARKLYSPLGLDEHIAIGNLGLVEAARRFDPTRGAKFSTYAANYIHNYIRIAIVRESGVFRTNEQRKTFWGIKRAVASGHTTPEDIAAFIGVSVEVVEHNAQHLLRGIVSLDTPIFDDGEKHTVGNRLVGDDSLTLRLEEDEARMMMRRAVRLLPPRLRRIIERRCFKDDPDLLDEIGRDMGITRERVRQLEAQAIKLLKMFVHGEPVRALRDRRYKKRKAVAA